METWETFTMSRKEVPRAGLLKAALAGKITNAQGALALHLTVRQFQRLKVRFAAEGARGLLHRLRGRPSPRRVAAEVRARAAALLHTTYAGLNDCHVTEKLQEVEGLSLRRSSVRRLRRALGLPPKRRRRGRQVRARRTPEAQMGALVQLDASPFAWLEDRGPTLALHGAIDDATGTARAPADAAAAWRPAPRDLPAVLSCRSTRTVARDNTVRLGPRWVQLSRRRSYAGRRVELRECLDGRLLVFADRHCLATQPAPSADFILRPRRGPSSDRRQRLRASQRRAAEGGRYPPPSCPKTRFFTSHGLDRGRAHADPHAPVASLRPLRTPQPGDDILTEQLA
jgi:transposase